MKTLKRIILAFQIYAIDITIAGQTEALGCIADLETKFRIEVARINARRERARLRAEYNALLPVGKRRVWRIACGTNQETQKSTE